MENRCGDENARLLSLRRNVYTILREMREIIDGGLNHPPGRGDLGDGDGQETSQSILRESIGRRAAVPNNEVDAVINEQGLGSVRGSSYLTTTHKKNLVEGFGDDGMAFTEEARQDGGTMPELNVDEKEGGGEAVEAEEERGSPTSMNGIGSVTSGDVGDEHSKDGRDGFKMINDDEGEDGGATESGNEYAPQLMVHKDPARADLGADSQTRIGDGQVWLGQEIGRVILRSRNRSGASVPNKEGDAAINVQAQGISSFKTTSEKNFVRKSNHLDDGYQNSVDREIRFEEFGDVRLGEGGGVISQEEGMPFGEEARQDMGTVPELNVDDKEGDTEVVESEQKGSASSIDGIVSVTSGMDEGCIRDANVGSVSHDEREGLIAIGENEQLPDANNLLVDNQNQYPSLEMAKTRRPPSLRARRSGKWHPRKE